MGFNAFGARGVAIVDSLPPLAALSALGQGWLDLGVIPAVHRDYDGHLYQPGGIAPRTGVTGLTKTTSGVLLGDTFTGGAGPLVGHAPELGAGVYAAGPEGSTSLSGTGNARPATVVNTGRPNAVLTLITGVGAKNFTALIKLASVPGGGDPQRGFALVARYNSLADMALIEIGNVAVAPTQLGVYVDAPGSAGFASWALAAGDVLKAVWKNAALTIYRGAVAGWNDPDVGGAMTGTQFGLARLGLVGDVVVGDDGSWDQLVICNGHDLKIQGVRPGWAAKLFDAADVQLAAGAENGSGTITLADVSALSTLGIDGFTGHLQLYTDNTYATPVANGRSPTVGNAAGIYPGDVYQWSF